MQIQPYKVDPKALKQDRIDWLGAMPSIQLSPFSAKSSHQMKSEIGKGKAPPHFYAESSHEIKSRARKFWKSKRHRRMIV
jgi:hypothetical protein